MLDKKIIQAAIDSIGDIKELRRHVQELWRNVSALTCDHKTCGVLAIIDGFVHQVEELNEKQAEAVIRKLKELSDKPITDEQIVATREEFVELGYNPMAWMSHIKAKDLEIWKDFMDLEDAS